MKAVEIKDIKIAENSKQEENFEINQNVDKKLESEISKTQIDTIEANNNFETGIINY